MQWDPAFKPTLRPIEAIRLPPGNSHPIGLRDRSGLSEAIVTLTEPALQLVALMDGVRTCEQIRSEFRDAFGVSVPAETLAVMLEQLEQALFLEGQAFEDHYRERQNNYLRAGVRPMRTGSGMGIPEFSAAFFAGILNESNAPEFSGRVAGIVAPHLDYPRGLPCYADAYGALRNRPAPRRVVILGTNHFGRSTAVVGTGSAFETPFGTTKTDGDFLQQLESRLGPLRAYELDHAREHSVELQVAWLQHLFGAESFQMVAFLCPDPCGPSGTAPSDGKGPDLREFAKVLGESIRSDGNETLLVAGADLSHVGGSFGDDRLLDDRFLHDVEERDRRAIKRLINGGAESFRQGLAEENNPTRVCSAGCIYALATALEGSTAHLLRYHQAVVAEMQNCVTCAALAFTGCG